MSTQAPDRGLAVALTDEQEDAIERRRGALLLAANAGSGKTTVLVERFVRAVHEDGVAPGRILAITFTERAAGELRERVRRRLGELGDRAAARETEAAFVSTIHGFCARLLRAHPLAAGLAPGFVVLDEGTAAGLRQEAFDGALAAWMTGPAELDLAAACGIDGLAAAIGRAHDELRSRGMSRPRLPGAGPRHDAAAALSGLREAAAGFARELDAAGPPAGRRVADARNQLERLSSVELAGEGAGPEHRRAGVELDELKIHRGAKALKSAAADAYEAARSRCCEARDDALGVLGLDLLGRLLDGFASDFAGRKRARGALDFDDLELCARDLLVGDAELRERWSERFELLMIDELQDTNPREIEILGALDRGNLFTVGDEFQSIYGFRHADVGIFRRRRRELAAGDGVRVLSRNFRSRPALLAAINAAFAPLFGPDFVPLVAGRDDPPGDGIGGGGLGAGIGGGGLGAGIGGGGLTDAIGGGLGDAIGGGLGDGTGGGGLGDGTGGGGLADGTGGAGLADGTGGGELGDGIGGGGPGDWSRRAGPGHASGGADGSGCEARGDAGPGDEPLVELMLSDSAGWQETAPGEEPGPGPPWRRAEARLLAVRIAELIETGAARAGEIVVLLRYATAAGVYGQALAERGIPIAAALGGGFYAAQEIADLGAYVRVLANPLDDVALYGVLASPLCGLRADGLAVIGMAARSLDRPPWEVLVAAGTGEPTASRLLAGLTDDEAARLTGARALIERERAAAAGLGLADLLVRSGYRERGLAGRGAALGLANIHKLLRLAREFEAREGRDLRGFADRLAAGRLGSSREQHAQLADTDAVRLMTVHAAKGLEFPVVCVADLGHGPPIGAPVILTDGDLVGLRLPTLDAGKPAEAFAYTELRARQGKAALDEEQRIAYVAMTRARERLILSGAAHFAHWPTAGPFAPVIAWLGPALVADLDERLAGPTGVSELELGGARLRLTLTAAGDMPALRDAVVPALLTAAEPPAPRGEPRMAYEQLDLFADPRPADQSPGGVPAPAVPPAAVTPGPVEPPFSRLGPPVRSAAVTPGPVEPPFSRLGSPVASAAATPAPADPRETAAERSPASGAAGSRPPQTSPVHATGLPPPSSISYSSLVDFGRCGYGYYLRRVLGLAEAPQPPGLEPAGGYDAAARGRIVHAVLERCDFARPLDPPPALVLALAGAPAPPAAELAAIAELAGAFARSPLCARLAAAATISREASFALPVGDLLVNGYIDVLAGEADGRMLVVDYKTDRIDPDTDLVGRVAADYEIQRQIYALAALRAGASGVEVAYCFLHRPEEVVGERYTAADGARLEAGLAGLAAPLLAGRFDVSARPHRGLCATCPGRARLCSWDEAATLAEQSVVQDA